MFIYIKIKQSYVRTLVNLIAVSLLIFGIDVNTSTVFKQFKSQPDYFQATCQEGDNVFTEETRNLTECLVLCAQTTSCYTALYNQPQCRGCARFYASTDLITEGTTHYQWTSVCDVGWLPWNKSCYGISALGTFQQGKAYCEEKGAVAAAVETKSENEFLKQMMMNLEKTIAVSVHKRYNLGITDNCSGNGEWRQTLDGNLITFTDFNIGEPNSPTEECCIGLYKGFGYRWIDSSCSAITNTVCEKHLP